MCISVISSSSTLILSPSAATPSCHQICWNFCESQLCSLTHTVDVDRSWCKPATRHLWRAVLSSLAISVCYCATGNKNNNNNNNLTSYPNLNLVSSGIDVNKPTALTFFFHGDFAGLVFSHAKQTPNTIFWGASLLPPWFNHAQDDCD